MEEKNRFFSDAGDDAGEGGGSTPDPVVDPGLQEDEEGEEGLELYPEDEDDYKDPVEEME